MTTEVLVDIECPKCDEYQLCYVAATQEQAERILANMPLCVSCQLEAVLERAGQSVQP